MSCVVELLRSRSWPRAVALAADRYRRRRLQLRNDVASTTIHSRRKARRARSPARCRRRPRRSAASSRARCRRRPRAAPATVRRTHSERQAGAGAWPPTSPRHRPRPKSPARCSRRRPPASAPRRQWSWDGGTAVTVGSGETVDVIARRYGVPASAIMQANNSRAGRAIHPGQRLVIPRYKQAAAPAVAQPAVARRRSRPASQVRARGAARPMVRASTWSRPAIR